MICFLVKTKLLEATWNSQSIIIINLYFVYQSIYYKQEY